MRRLAMQHPVLVALVCILFLLYLTQPSSGISSLVASNSEDSLAVEVQAYASFEDETTTLLEQEIEIMLDSQHKIQLEGNAKPSEEQDLDRARKAGAPTLGTNGAWKRVPVNPSGPNAKLVAALHRVSGEIFKALNDNMTTGPKYTKCTKFGEVMMKSSTGIEYKFRCEALFTNQTPRQLVVHAWDRYGLVSLIDFHDVSERDESETPNTRPNPWYYDETHPMKLE